SDEQRRAVERHTQIGADLAARVLPSGAWLGEAAAGHPERVDGGGYPGGRREAHLAPPPRLLAVRGACAPPSSPRPRRLPRGSGAARWGSASLSWLSMGRRSTYLVATRHPWSCFVFLAPLLAAYEGGVFLLGGAHAQALRNGADTWLRWALEYFGFSQLYWAPL